jgi:hypothetical protein
VGERPWLVSRARLKTSKFIFEFDIKGFFDNISHASIIQTFKENLFYSSPITTWVSRILDTKPTSYTLPPVQNYRERFMAAYNDYETYHDPITFKTEYWNCKTPANPMEEEQLRKLSDLSTGYRMWSRPTKINGKTYYIVVTDTLSNKSLGESRDTWYNLGLKGRGVPQGLNTSPFISTIMTDKVFYDLGLWKAIIMYMDDGLLFAETREEMIKHIQMLKAGLSALGLSMAMEKSGILKEDGKWVRSMKFLGLRYLPEEDTLMSDTRSGTQVKFPTKGDWNDIKLMAVQNQLSVPYMRKKFDKLINTQAYETGLKYGFLGCLIAGSQYKEAMTMVERKEAIQIGQASSWARITESKGYVWKHQDLMNFPETLTNVSSIASHRFAEANRLGYKLHIRRGGKVRRTNVRMQRALA